MERDLDPKYTAMCSEQTIYSNKEGFFGEFFDSLKKASPKKWMNKVFGGAKSDRERFVSVLEEPNVSGTLFGMLEHVTAVYKQKDAKGSALRRHEGEKLLACGEVKKAVILLSQAVLRAPTKGENLTVDGGLSLAFALWSRSQAFIALNDGKSALADLQCSLNNGLPAKHHGEYYVRLARANALIGSKAKAEICLNLADRLSENQLNIEKLREEIGMISSHPVDPIAKVPELSSGENPQLESASNNIDLTSSDGVGNYVKAKTNIKTGDVLLVEKPIVSSLLDKFFGTHCLHCKQRLVAPQGCDDCSGVAFCSVQCKKIACSTYHKYECKFMDLLIGSGMSILCFLALRLITQSTTPELALQNGRKIISDLCTHSDRRSNDDYLQRCTMTAFLLRVLQKAEYFGRRTTESAEPTNAELDIAEVILGLLQVLQFNAHEIFETRHGETHRFMGAKPVYIGVALYKTGAYFNHDCYPSVTRYFVGSTIVLCATHPLKPGDMVGENYGPIFTKKTLLERSRSLMSRYWFKCECKCCKENWQILDKLNNKARLKCTTPLCDGVHNYPEDPRKTVKCLKCKKMVSLQEHAALLLECEELYRKGAEFMDKEDTQSAIDKFIEGIDLFYAIAVAPHKNMHLAEESLKACYGDQGTVVSLKQ
ncbi:SET and MYND domain-containing protein 4 [Bradysia coprophila]|uniref:SET and MYND domain-containing protein 4 n=1 Tax=Bradysia coprophila TaxID=38358 RepID=UPI00187D8B4F|nr:SET and MYND domain-containing protein 4 [Bradysia coprophila]